MRYRIKGLDKYIKSLENLSESYNVLISIENAVTDGSIVVRDVTKQELNKLPTDDTPKRVKKRKGIRTIEKKFLLSTFGVSPSEKSFNDVNRKTGVNLATLQYRNSKSYLPAVTLARRLERGTSYMDKDPVFSRSSRKARKPCVDAMQESLNRDFEKAMNLAKLQRREIDG